MNTRNLSEVVEFVKSSMYSGRPLSDSFGDTVTQHNRTRCIAKIALEGLWHGEGPLGWIAPKTFWDMVAFIWHRAPDFFVADDPGRAINEAPTCWDQKYLDVQRNYLRHNFSLRRLCHLVMVYEYLHGAEAAVSRPSPHSRVEPSCSTIVSPLQSSRPKRSHLGGAITVGCLILVIVVSVILLRGRTTPPTVPNPPEAVQDSATDQIEEAKKSVAEKTELAKDDSAVKAPAQDELKEPTKAKSDSVLLETDVCKKDNAQSPKSNDVENASIALPELAPGDEKAPVHQSKAPVGKE